MYLIREVHREELPCGCIPGEYACSKAVELWENYLRSLDDGRDPFELTEEKKKYLEHIGGR